MDPIPDDDDDDHGGVNVFGETSVAGQLVDRVTVVSWNCAIFFGTRPLTSSHRQRHIRKINRVGQLATKYDVVMLQETHGRVDDLIAFCRGMGSSGPSVLIRMPVGLLLLLLLFHPPCLGGLVLLVLLGKLPVAELWLWS